MINNLTVSEMEKKDKLWLNSFREKCLQEPPDSSPPNYTQNFPKNLLKYKKPEKFFHFYIRGLLKSI